MNIRKRTGDKVTFSESNTYWNMFDMFDTVSYTVSYSVRWSCGNPTALPQNTYVPPWLLRPAVVKRWYTYNSHGPFLQELLKEIITLFYRQNKLNINYADTIWWPSLPQQLEPKCPDFVSAVTVVQIHGHTSDTFQFLIQKELDYDCVHRGKQVIYWVSTKRLRGKFCLKCPCGPVQLNAW